MAWPLIAAAALPVVGGVVGQIASGGDRRRADDAARRGLESIEGIDLPTIEQMQIALEQYQVTGQLTPQMEQAIQLGQSEMQKVSTDPKLREIQMGALKNLYERSQKGFGAEEAADIAKMNRGVNQAYGQRAASIQQQAQQQGMGGSGAELASKMMASQQAAESANQQSTDLAALATRRALEAAQMSGNMGTQMRTQEFDEGARKANAADIIAQWNAQNSQATQGRNVNRSNYGQEYNLANQQRIAEQNVDVKNKQQMYNKGLYQQDFDNRLNLGQAKSGAYATEADRYGKKAQDTREFWAKIGGGAGQAIGGIAKKG